MGLSYPAEPWDLHGKAAASLFVVPAERLGVPPPGTKLVTFGRSALVTAAFFRYLAPSALRYDEVMVTVLVREGWRLRIWIRQIWVDSPASRDGGSELWAIPKDMAVFSELSDGRWRADGLATLHARKCLGLPGLFPLGFSVAQQRRLTTQVTPVRGRLRLNMIATSWRFEGALDYLDDRSPLLSVAASFQLLFGQSTSSGTAVRSILCKVATMGSTSVSRRKVRARRHEVGVGRFEEPH